MKMIKTRTTCLFLGVFLSLFIISPLVAFAQALTYSVYGHTNGNGSVYPASTPVLAGQTTTLSITPDSGYAIYSVGGTCGSGTLNGTQYTTSAINADCQVNVAFAPQSLSYQQYAEVLTKLYVTILDWPAIMGDLIYYASQGDMLAVADGLFTYKQYYYGYYNGTLEDTINAFYWNAFGRAAEPAGLQWYVEQVNLGNITSGGALAWAIIFGAQNEDVSALNSKVQAFLDWTLNHTL
jgi:hypothetical protein